MEDCYMAKATERIFLPLLNTILPEVHDFWMPWEGVFHNITVIAINKEYPGHARRVMSALWGQGQMSFCKALVIVDADVDLKQPGKLLEALLNRVDLAEDLYVTEGVLDVLDHSAPDPVFGGKLGIDATRRLSGENQRRVPQGSDLPPHADALTALKKVSERIVDGFIPRLDVRNPLLLFSIAKDGTFSARSLADPLFDQAALQPFTIMVAYDPGVDLADPSVVLWKVFNNVDPKRDILRREQRIFVDATKKGPEDGHDRPWPDDIVMDPEIVRRVEDRARELGIEAYLR